MNEYSFTDLTKEQHIAKIIFDISKHDANNSQAKLSLLQDLIIALLPHVKEGNNIYKKLMSVRCNAPSENIIQWIDGMAKVYLADPNVAQVLISLTKEQMDRPY